MGLTNLLCFYLSREQLYVSQDSIKEMCNCLYTLITTIVAAIVVLGSMLMVVANIFRFGFGGDAFRNQVFGDELAEALEYGTGIGSSFATLWVTMSSAAVSTAGSILSAYFGYVMYKDRDADSKTATDQAKHS